MLITYVSINRTYVFDQCWCKAPSFVGARLRLASCTLLVQGSVLHLKNILLTRGSVSRLVSIDV